MRESKRRNNDYKLIYCGFYMISEVRLAAVFVRREIRRLLVKNVVFLFINVLFLTNRD